MTLPLGTLKTGMILQYEKKNAFYIVKLNKF